MDWVMAFRISVVVCIMFMIAGVLTVLEISHHREMAAIEHMVGKGYSPIEAQCALAIRTGSSVHKALQALQCKVLLENTDVSR